MTSIIIYTTAEVLMHKQGKLPYDEDFSEKGEYYWELKKRPKKLKDGDRIYFAVKGYIRGYFKIEDIEDEVDWFSINFYSDTWKNITLIDCRPFQGFKYADKVKGLK